jgi:hypothetical protein
VLRRALVCFGFSTWCFLNTWVALADPGKIYFLRYTPARTILPAVVASEILVALAMLAIWELCRRRLLYHPRIIDALFLVACVVPIGIASTAIVRVVPWDLTKIIQMRFFWPVALVAAALPAGFAVRHPRAGARFMRSVFLWSWPVLATVLLQATFGTLLRYRAQEYSDRPLAARLPSARRNRRVVWIVFDELSQAITFGNRPRGLNLANFDRLKAESFYATSAFAPGGSTLMSMPGLILGEEVTRSKPEGPSELLLQTRTHVDWFSWSSSANVFDTARESGFDTALVGWYHPYGRLLNRSLTECYWTANGIEPGLEESEEPQALWPAMASRAQLQLANLPLAGHIPALSPRRHHRRVLADHFTYLMDRALQLAVDPRAGLVLLHLPVPHPPAIYSRSKAAMVTDGPGGYADNVALADHALGELRMKMEQAGLWGPSAVIVSADHGWRVNLWRVFSDWSAEEEALSSTDTAAVPFIVKLPGQTDQVLYDKPFNTVVTRKLITAILQQRLTNAHEIRAMIEAGN